MAKFFNSLPRVELYDLRTDPCETVNIAAQQPDVVQQLDGLLGGFVKRNPTRLIAE